MSKPGDLRRKLRNHIGATVAISLMAVGLLQFGASGFLAELADGKFKPGVEEYLRFGQLYWGALLMSLTLTLAVASWTLPPLFDMTQNFALPGFVVVGGAFLLANATRPAVVGSVTQPLGRADVVMQPTGGGYVGALGGALRVFVSHYGEAAVGGLVVGLAGGLIVHLVAEYLVKGTVS
ncbi:hypothetical protein [Lentzea sp. NPDC092896]|uniref:hypothetical protein n=1 Tax=Lentzea sp. NPDC092896 TaxID=3364127 RepID=UPI003827F355